LNNQIHKLFADALLLVVPDFPMGAAEIETMIKTQGFEGFLHIANSYDAEIAEVLDLLRLGTGGVEHGS